MVTRHELLAFVFASGLVQGAFLAPIVANIQNVNRRAVRLLAVLILCLLPMVAEEFFEAAGLLRRFPHMIGTSITMDFLVAPLLLFYARALMQPARQFSRRDWLHFLPFVTATLIWLPFGTLSGPEKIAAVRGGLPTSFHVIIAGKILMAGAYLTVILVQLRRFTTNRDDPRAKDPHVVWLQRMLVGLSAVVLASLALGILSNAGVPVPFNSDDVGTLFICGSIYVVSALLIRHPLAAQAAPFKSARAKYETSPLDDRQKQDHLDRLNRLMQREKPYLDMTLSLERLADTARIPASHLSQVLNERLGVNFYEFVNSYRVREVQDRLADPAHSGKTLIAIAHDSGFNSKASFNRAFKRLTGQTPSEYARARSGDEEIVAG